MTNASNREWVKSGLEFWSSQVKKHPRRKHEREQYEMFVIWAKALGLPIPAVK